MKIDRYTRQRGARAVEQSSFEKLPIDGVPWSATPLPDQAHPYNQNDLFTGVEQVKAAALTALLDRHSGVRCV